MKKINLVFIFISSFHFAFAQKNKGQNFHWVSEQNAICFVGGQFHPNLYKYNDALNALGAKANFYEGLRCYGITIAEPWRIIRGGGFDVSSSYGLFMKSKVTIGPNDSLYYEMKGWHFMSSIIGKDIIPGKTIALVLAPGIDWGMLKTIRTVSGNGSLFKDAFIAPLGRAEMRFVFGPVALGARFCYRYDVTSDAWKLKKGTAYTLPGVKNTGTSLEFFVGWGHVHFQ